MSEYHLVTSTSIYAQHFANCVLKYRMEFLSECKTLRQHQKQHEKDVKQRREQLQKDAELHRLAEAGLLNKSLHCLH